MSGPRMKVSVSANLGEAALELLPASGLQGEVRMTMEQISVLIVRLGEARSALMSRYNIPPITGSPVVLAFKTQWAVRPEALSEGSILAFQHPAYGPVGLVLPPPDVEKLVRALRSHLTAPHRRDVSLS